MAQLLRHCVARRRCRRQVAKALVYGQIVHKKAGLEGFVRHQREVRS